MAQKSEDIENKEIEPTGDEVMNKKMIESITKLNQNVESLVGNCSVLVTRIKDVANKIDVHSTKADQLTKHMSAEQQAVRDSIRMEISKGIRSSMRQMDKEIKDISKSAQKQIDSYTEESRIRRDVYERSKSKDRFITWFNTGLLIITIAILICFS